MRDHTDQLDCDHQDGLEGKGSVAEVKKVLQTGAQQLQHHSIVFPTRPKVVHLRNTLWTHENIQLENRSTELWNLSSNWQFHTDYIRLHKDKEQSSFVIWCSAFLDVLGAIIRSYEVDMNLFLNILINTKFLCTIGIGLGNLLGTYEHCEYFVFLAN